VWLLAVVVFVGAVGGWTVYRNALAEAGAFFDITCDRPRSFSETNRSSIYLLGPQIIPPTMSLRLRRAGLDVDGVPAGRSAPLPGAFSPP